MNLKNLVFSGITVTAILIAGVAGVFWAEETIKQKEAQTVEQV